MTVQQFIQQTLQTLVTTTTDEREAKAILRVLVEDGLGVLPINFFSYELSNAEVEFLKEKLKELQTNKPIQQVVGKAYFYGLVYQINEHVLIPRPETEEFVHQILKDTRDSPPKVILEVGTGSGCIAISLAKNLPQTKVYAIDVSENALAIARQNAVYHQVENIDFVHLDFLERRNYSTLPVVDILVSNPPYIQLAEKETMHANVLDFEPHLALFVEDIRPLIFYEALIDFSKTNLNINGSIYAEINQYLAKETKDLFIRSTYKRVTLFKDLQDNYRFLCAKKPE